MCPPTNIEAQLIDDIDLESVIEAVTVFGHVRQTCLIHHGWFEEKTKDPQSHGSADPEDEEQAL